MRDYHHNVGPPAPWQTLVGLSSSSSSGLAVINAIIDWLTHCVVPSIRLRTQVWSSRLLTTLRTTTTATPRRLLTRPTTITTTLLFLRMRLHPLASETSSGLPSTAPLPPARWVGQTRGNWCWCNSGFRISASLCFSHHAARLRHARGWLPASDAGSGEQPARARSAAWAWACRTTPRPREGAGAGQRQRAGQGEGPLPQVIPPPPPGPPPSSCAEDVFILTLFLVGF